MSTQLLTDLIQQKREVLRQLREVTTRQGEQLQAGRRPVELMPLLAVKQQLLDQLDVVEERLAPFRDEDPDARPWPTPQHRQQCAQVADECNSLLAELIQLEEGSLAAAQTAQDVTAAALDQSGVAAQARAAYASPASTARPQIDLASDA